MQHLRRLRALLIVLVLGVLVTACGNTGKHQTSTSSVSLPKAEAECPAATEGSGSMGACAPPSVGLSAPPRVGGTLGVSHAPRFVDLSNNDPCYCATALRRAGYRGEIDKANQGTGFVDSTFVRMIDGARKARLAVGGYDFDETYSVAEAKLFVARLRAAGITPRGHNEFPAVFDVEYGSFSISGLRAQIAYVQHQGYRVEVYTGAWYWTPHAGCQWVGVRAWLAGYPTAPVFCGLTASLYVNHQYTDHASIGGGHSSDASVHIAGSWQTEVNAAPSPKVRAELKAARVARARNEIRERRQKCGHLRASRKQDRDRCSIERARVQKFSKQINHLTKES